MIQQVLIAGDGHHVPAGQHYMAVDDHGFLIDLSGVTGDLHDPAILRVTWGLVPDGNRLREGGEIVRRAGPAQRFFDRTLLVPYLEAWAARKAELLPARSAESPGPTADSATVLPMPR